MSESDLREFEIKNYENWSTFYAEEAAKLQTFLKQFGFDKSDLLASRSCNEKFNALISIAQKLKQDEFDLSKGVSSLIDEKFEQEKLSLSLERERCDLDEKLRKVHMFHENLVKDYANEIALVPCQMKQLSDMESNIQYMQVKLEKYKNQINENEVKLHGVDSKLFHENIFAQFKLLEAMQASIQEAKEKLDMYQDLPPSLDDAKVKLDTMRAQIKRMDQEIETKFGYLDS